MAHTHSVYDNDTHFVISHINRGFTNEGSLKTLVVQNDHNSERFTFELPRYIEGHDMLLCNRVEVHYLNVDGQTKDTSSGIYEVEDLQESPEDENIAILSWLVSSHATKYVGSLNFCIRFACVNEETSVLEYSWSTVINSNIHVTSGINNAEVIIQEYADVLEKWRKDISANITDFLPEQLQFGESETGGDTLNFDGNAEGKDLVGGMLVQVSNATPTLTTGTVEIVVSGNTNSVQFTENEVMELAKGFKCIVLDMPFVAIVTSEAVGVDIDGITFEKEGTYFICTEEDGMPMYVKSLKIDGCTDFPSIKKLDTKYLPEQLQFGEYKSETGGDTLTWDGDTTGKEITGNDLLVKVSDIVPTLEDFANGASITISNTIEMDVTEEVAKSSDGKCIRIGLWVKIALEDYAEGSNAYTKGIYFYKNTSNGDTVTKLKINGYKGFPSTVVKPIETKYLPTPIVFTTADMQSATCNKTYQECVEALNNYCFNGYLIMGTVDVGQIGSFNMIAKSKDVVNDVVTREFINFVMVIDSTTLTIQYDNNNEITIIIEEA